MKALLKIRAEPLQPVTSCSVAAEDLADTVKRLRHAMRSAGELLAQANQFHRTGPFFGVQGFFFCGFKVF